MKIKRSYEFGWILALAVMCMGLVATPTVNAADRLTLVLPAKSFLNLVEFVAQDRGFYAEEDLNVQFLHIRDSSIPVKTLIAGQVDVIATGMAETLTAIDNGANLRTIGGVHTGLHYAFWARKGSGIDSIEDLPGKRVGISSPGSLPHVVILALLHQAGVPEREIAKIHWVAVQGSSARRQAIMVGTLDATVAGYDPKAERDPNAKVLFSVPQRLPKYVMTPWDVRANFLEKNPDILRRFIRAELRATRWIFENEDKALEVAANHFNYSEKDLRDFYDFYRNGGVWNPNGLVTEEQARYMQELNVQSGMQDTIRPIDDVLDTSLVESVLDDIGWYQQ